MEEKLLSRVLRSRLFWAGMVLAGLGLLLVYASLDEAPPDVADLVCPREEVPPIENGLLLLDIDKEDLHWPRFEAPMEEDIEEAEGEEEASEVQMRTINPSDLANGTFWDPEWARDVLAGNEEVMRKVDEALRLPRFQLPEFTTIDEAVKHVSRFPAFRIRELISIRMRLHEQDGREKEAVEDLFRLVTLGHRLAAAHGSFIHFMQGAAIKNLALGEVLELFQRGVSDPCTSTARIREIQRMEIKESLESALKAEYALGSEYIDAWREHSEHLLDGGAPWIWRNPFCMKPNQTKRLYAEAVRAGIRNLSLPPSSRRTIRPRGIPSQELPRWLPYPNALGKESLRGTLNALENMLSLQVSADTLLSFTAALIAIKCWQARNGGALPPTLDALVPEYLDEVPRDPYDGKPIRYSAEKRIIYSVGMDGVDSGGSTQAESRAALWDEAEPTLRIEAPPRGG
jgi:hypothetical protein